MVVVCKDVWDLDQWFPLRFTVWHSLGLYSSVLESNKTVGLSSSSYKICSYFLCSIILLVLFAFLHFPLIFFLASKVWLALLDNFSFPFSMYSM